MTNGKSDLKLVILYDAGNNKYGVSAHNLVPEEADRLIQEWNQHLVDGCRLLSLKQQKQHKATNPEDCRTCRKAVAHSSGLEPKPTFTRRKP